MSKTPLDSLKFLGVECGGTRTVAILADANDQLLQRLEAGPANLRLVSDAQLERHFRFLADGLDVPAGLGIGMAGVRDATDCARVQGVAAKVWPGVPCRVGHDLETALEACQSLPRAAVGGGASTGFERPFGGAGSARKIARRAAKATETVVVLESGTGSCCFGRNPSGQTAKVGGWGHLLGDRGSAYEIAMESLRAVVCHYDRGRVLSPLGRRFLRALQLNDLEPLIAWVQAAGKAEVAALAVEVFAASGDDKDKIARQVLSRAEENLAEDATRCAARLDEKGSTVRFVLSGSVLLKQPEFARAVSRAIRRRWSGAEVGPMPRDSVWGAVVLARKAFEDAAEESRRDGFRGDRHRQGLRSHGARRLPRAGSPVPDSVRLSPTEERNPRSMDLDRLPIGKAIELMLSEDAGVPATLLTRKREIGRAVGLVVRAFRSGGRLFYVGAGTSGRLGVLDASECPPTFRTPPEQVQAILAGGPAAVWRSVEGAEDDRLAGGEAVAFRGVRAGDLVVGIAASGRTPFVWGALVRAAQLGATTALIAFNPHLRIPPTLRPTLVLTADLGPEVLTGSTRLKAGTATKLILNILTTLSMVRLGKVVGNLMVDVDPSNAKLRDRAVRILRELTGCQLDVARAALEESGWVVKEAWWKLRSNRSNRIARAE